MAIVPKVIGPTALSSTTEVLLGGAALELPADARTILSVKPVVSSPAGNTPGEPGACAKLKLESDDVKGLNPFIVLAQPIGSALGAAEQVAGQGPIKDVEYPINCPVKGGEKIKVYGAGLFDHTIEPYMLAVIKYATFRVDPIKYPQLWSVVGTFTNTGTAVGETGPSSTKIEIVGGRRIKEVSGFVVGTTVATLKGLMGKFRLNSDGFTDSGDIEFAPNPICGSLDTAIFEFNPGVHREKVDVGLKSKATINDYFNLGVALTTTGNWIVGVMYI